MLTSNSRSANISRRAVRRDYTIAKTVNVAPAVLADATRKIFYGQEQSVVN